MWRNTEIGVVIHGSGRVIRFPYTPVFPLVRFKRV